MPGALSSSLFLHSGFAWMLYNSFCLPVFLKCYCRHCLDFLVSLWKDGCLEGTNSAAMMVSFISLNLFLSKCPNIEAVSPV